MSGLRVMYLFLLLASSACSAFGSGAAVELSTEGGAAASEWHATLSSPAAMAGVVQMSGSVSMAPGPDSASTIATISLANASPGGLHPWEIRRGDCRATSRVATLGSSDAYGPLEVNADGRARATATIDSRYPTTGQYSAVVLASAENDRTVVACGNLAPPTR